MLQSVLSWGGLIRSLDCTKILEFESYRMYQCNIATMFGPSDVNIKLDRSKYILRPLWNVYSMTCLCNSISLRGLAALSTCVQRNNWTFLTRSESLRWMPSSRVCPAWLQSQGPTKGESKCKHDFQSAETWQKNTDIDHQTYFIAEDLIKWPTTSYKAAHSSQPQAQEAIVDTLHQHNLTHNEDWVPDVAAEVADHFWQMLHLQDQTMLRTGLECRLLVHPMWPADDLKIWKEKLKALH